MRIGIINVGASAFRMYVAEFVGNENRALDSLIKPLRLGTDTFTQGYISLDNVKKSTDILRSFKLKLDEYGVTRYRAMCTSGVREASNKDFFLDYTLLHSGIKLEVLDSSEEIYIKYVGAKNSVKGFEQMEQEGLIFANVASGNIALNATIKNRFLFSGTLPYGSLRLRQMFSPIPHIKRHKAIEEYVRIMINEVASTIEPGVKLRHVVGAGSSINMLSRLIPTKNNIITLGQLTDVYAMVRTMTANEMAEELGLRRDESNVVVSTIITYIELMELVGAKQFTFSSLTFPNIMALYYGGRISDSHQSGRIKNTLISIAKKYRVDIRHAKWVNYFARKMFDAFTDMHSLDRSMRIILETAALLYDVGRYISNDNSTQSSYYIIKSLKMPGLPDKMLILSAGIVFEAGKLPGYREPAEYSKLTGEDMLIIHKMSAILRIAKAMDAGRSRNINNIEINVSDRVVITANTEREPYLEIFDFDRQKKHFTETFGIPIELRARINYE